MGRFLMIGLLSFALAGCSSRLAYNNLDWLAGWYLDDYVELTKAQENVFQIHLDEVLQWHREEELQQYHQHLQRLKQDVITQPLSSKQWESHLVDLRNHWTMIRFQVSLKLVALASELSPDQIEEFFNNLSAKNQRDREEFLDLESGERQEKMIERVEDAVKDRIGRITPEQQTLVKEFVESRVETRLEYLAYTANLQGTAKALVSNGHQAHFSDKLLKVLSEPDQFQDEEYKQKVAHNRKLLISFLTKLNQSMSEKQTQYFVNHIDDLMETIEDLQRKEG